MSLAPPHPAGTLRLTTWGDHSLEPAPVTPANEAPYRLLAGTIRATWESGIGKAKNESIIVAPGLKPTNTGLLYALSRLHVLIAS